MADFLRPSPSLPWLVGCHSHWLKRNTHSWTSQWLYHVYHSLFPIQTSINMEKNLRSSAQKKLVIVCSATTELHTKTNHQVTCDSPSSIQYININKIYIWYPMVSSGNQAWHLKLFYQWCFNHAASGEISRRPSSTEGCIHEWSTYKKCTYPLVNIQKAIENGHRNSGFTHKIRNGDFP